MGVAGGLDAVAPGGLRRVERLVGAGEERLGVAALGGPGRSPPGMDASALVDPTRLPELRADYGDVAVQLLELFERTAAETLGELHMALAAGDREEVRRLAHRLKGSARNVGATGMADLSAALQAAGARPPRGRLRADVRGAAGRARRVA